MSSSGSMNYQTAKFKKELPKPTSYGEAHQIANWTSKEGRAHSGCHRCDAWRARAYNRAEH
jgi:hypothetical protein